MKAVVEWVSGLVGLVLYALAFGLGWALQWVLDIGRLVIAGFIDGRADTWGEGVK